MTIFLQELAKIHRGSASLAAYREGCSKFPPTNPYWTYYQTNPSTTATFSSSGVNWQAVLAVSDANGDWDNFCYSIRPYFFQEGYLDYSITMPSCSHEPFFMLAEVTGFKPSLGFGQPNAYQMWKNGSTSGWYIRKFVNGVGTFLASNMSAGLNSTRWDIVISGGSIDFFNYEASTTDTVDTWALPSYNCYIMVGSFGTQVATGTAVFDEIQWAFNSIVPST